MHANNQLPEDDMLTSNKYMVNRIAGLLTAIANNNWLQLKLLLAYHRLFGTVWYESFDLKAMKWENALKRLH